MRLILSLLFCCAALPARADLLITGRDAQKLQCAAMIMLLSDHLDAYEVIPPEMHMQARISVIALLNPLPGTERERVRALLQRMKKLRETRTPLVLMQEFERSAMWCAKAADE